jgi:phage gp36-like protein
MLKFLKPSDFQMKIKDNVFADILDADETGVGPENEKLQLAERQAIEMMDSYIGNVYDMEFMLSRKDEERNIVIIDILTTLVVYLLFQRTTIDIIPEQRLTDYENKIQTIKDLRDGKINIKSPKKNINYDNRLQNLYSNNINTINDWDY